MRFLIINFLVQFSFFGTVLGHFSQPNFKIFRCRPPFLLSPSHKKLPYIYTLMKDETSAKLDFFSTLSLSSLNRKAALGKTFSCLGLQQSVAKADDIVQAT